MYMYMHIQKCVCAHTYTHNDIKEILLRYVVRLFDHRNTILKYVVFSGDGIVFLVQRQTTSKSSFHSFERSTKHNIIP